MFTRLLPIRMAARASSYFSVTRRASPACFEPSSRAFSRRMVLQEEKAISVAEKKAERHTQTMMPTITR